MTRQGITEPHLCKLEQQQPQQKKRVKNQITTKQFQVAREMYGLGQSKTKALIFSQFIANSVLNEQFKAEQNHSKGRNEWAFKIKNIKSFLFGCCCCIARRSANLKADIVHVITYCSIYLNVVNETMPQ